MSAETLTLFTQVTALCHRLLLMTSSDVYSMTVADLMALTEGGIHWQYRWSHDPTEVHGPESGEQMEQWRTSGFWETPADVRRVTANNDPLHYDWQCASDFATFLSDPQPLQTDDVEYESTLAHVETRVTGVDFMNVL
ncbi:MAG: hypothetical protein KVP17_000291 [Porospora cf. gigantea B]|nr:MAG: hypothetical protein KVP17_000291 [Porospora cf. gigantea B]